MTFFTFLELRAYALFADDFFVIYSAIGQLYMIFAGEYRVGPRMEAFATMLAQLHPDRSLLREEQTWLDGENTISVKARARMRTFDAAEVDICCLGGKSPLLEGGELRRWDKTLPLARQLRCMV